jgi:NADP-dependent 3-hydroxy acid dehydrogenase YdfG
VIATVRSLAKLPAVLKEAGVRPLALNLDESDDIVQQVAESAIQIYGHVDVLVNNAGSTLFGYGPIEEVRSVC